MQKIAGECKNPSSVIAALKSLEEHNEYLPQTLMPVLGPFGCQALAGEGLRGALESGKDAARKSLSQLSAKMLEGLLQGGNAEASEQLMQFCRSTELNDMLEENLETLYVLKPMSAKLAPSQGGSDFVCSKDTTAPKFDELMESMNSG